MWTGKFNKKGAILPIMAVGMVVLIGVVGLAIDSGLGYGVKAKLTAATDAAAIAVARAAATGDESIDHRAVAQKFFNANFPDGYLDGDPTLETVDVTNAGGRIIVNVTASAVKPTVFMGVMGRDRLNVSSGSQVIRQDLDMAFVVDVTGSLSSVGDQVRDAAVSFVNRFNETTDRMALISFAHGAVVDVPIETSDRGFDKSAVVSAIGNYTFAGLTNFSEGFWTAREQLNSIPAGNRSSLRVIVFFSDGAPNTFASTFQFADGTTYAGSVRTGDGSSGSPMGLYEYDQLRQSSGSPVSGGHDYGANIASVVATIPNFYNPHDPGENEFRIVKNFPRAVTNSPLDWNNVSRISRNLPEDMAAAARGTLTDRDRIYIFTLGLGNNLNSATGPDGEAGADILMRMANDRRMDTDPAWSHLRADFRSDQPSGQYCFAANEADLDACYARLASAIMRLSM